MLVISNTKFFKNNQLTQGKNIVVENETIIDITDKIPLSGNQIDVKGNYLAPGFIDLQIYGAAGRLFSAEPTIESLEIMETQLLKDGTTGFLACVATNTPDVFNTCIEIAKEHRRHAKNFLGLHLEGPFLNPKRAGAHVQEYIRKASLDEVKALIDFGDGTIKMMTIAPELQNDEVVKYLLDNGVVVSLGHSDATFEEANAAYAKGITTTTHLFNAMSAIHHRNPGIPSAVFNHPTAMASIIVDGEHLDFNVVKFAKQLMKERLFLITDAVTACNTGPYKHGMEGDKYVMPNGTLSGSSLTMLKAVRNCVRHCDIPFGEALNMASYYPAKLIGLDNFIGQIGVGKQANLVLINDNIELQAVFFKGESIPV